MPKGLKGHTAWGASQIAGSPLKALNNWKHFPGCDSGPCFTHTGTLLLVNSIVGLPGGQIRGVDNVHT